MRGQRGFVTRPVMPDLELGEERAENTSFENRANQWIVVALFLFLMMSFFPTSAIVVLVVMLLCVSGFSRMAFRMGQAQLVAASGNAEVERGLMRGLWNRSGLLGLPPTTNLSNLRLTLLNREFNESDYEMLVSLDNPPNRASAPDLPQALVDAIPKTQYIKDMTKQGMDPSIPGDRNRNSNSNESKSGDDNVQMCSICLEGFKEGDEVRVLPCQHIFHDHCILPWLRQKGMDSRCPVCNLKIFGA